ncbi:hypothetical protein G7085_20995 [Tessaracoccus sp. HDW20]|nr:hypothetical protein [Tessaracoccus coleopterorum]
MVTVAATLPEDQGLLEAVYTSALLAASAQSEENLGSVSFQVLVADNVRASGTEQHDMRTLARAIGRARLWTDAPGNRLGPTAFVDMLRQEAEAAGLHVECVGGEELVARGYGGLSAVAGASSESGWLVRLDYCPTGVDSLAPALALVGKGSPSTPGVVVEECIDDVLNEARHSRRRSGGGCYVRAP